MRGDSNADSNSNDNSNHSGGKFTLPDKKVVEVKVPEFVNKNGDISSKNKQSKMPGRIIPHLPPYN